MELEPAIRNVPHADGLIQTARNQGGIIHCYQLQNFTFMGTPRRHNETGTTVKHGYNTRRLTCCYPNTRCRHRQTPDQARRPQANLK